MAHPLLKHYVATLHYRASNVLDDAPSGFDSFSAGSGVRTPVEILAHMGDVLAFAVAKINNETLNEGQSRPDTTWKDEVARFYGKLQALHGALDSEKTVDEELAMRLLQGPLSDTMTHLGQLAMLSRMAGDPVAGENYFIADVSLENSSE